MAPDAQISGLREEAHRQDEVHPHAGGDEAKPALHRPGAFQHVVDQLEGKIA